MTLLDEIKIAIDDIDGELKDLRDATANIDIYLDTIYTAVEDLEEEINNFELDNRALEDEIRGLRDEVNAATDDLDVVIGVTQALIDLCEGANIDISHLHLEEMGL